MPQMKGAATWLTNPRQKTEPPKNIGIDNSDVRIENDLAQEMMSKELEAIHLQAHRAMADRMFDLNETKKDVDNYKRMKDLATKKNIKVLMQKRRESNIHGQYKAGNTSTSNVPPVQNANPNSTTQVSSVSMPNSSTIPSSTPIVPPRPKTSQPRTGFSRIELCDSDDDGDYFLRHRYPARPKSTPTATQTTRPKRRSRTANPARSRRQIREALEDEFSKAPGSNRPRRPKTTLGFAGHEDTRQVGGSTVPGRSFNELKDYTNIDSIHRVHRNQQQNQLYQIRENKITQERLQLQQKLANFYERLESFKTANTRNRTISTNYVPII